MTGKDIVLGLLVLFFLPGFGQVTNAQQQPAASDSTHKPANIVFRSEAKDSAAAIPLPKLTGGNIRFSEKKSITELITYMSDQRFEKHGQIQTLGDNGSTLKEAMGNHKQAIQMVDDAYSAKSTGTGLVIAGVAAALLTFAIKPTVELDKSTNGNVTTTVYWWPAITVGAILGGWGFSKINSFDSGINKAVTIYNQEPE